MRRRSGPFPAAPRIPARIPVLPAVLAAALAASAFAPASARADDVLFIGHSLVGVALPAMLDGLGGPGAGAVDAHVINGAPLKWNWEKAGRAQGVNARAALPSGKYEVVVMTEAGPIASHFRWSGSAGYAARFYGLAVASNPDARVYLYETWPDLRSGTGADVPHDKGDAVPWRRRLDDDLKSWESIVDQVNAARPPGARPMALIPAGRAMGLMHDAIERGEVPGIGSIRELFKDDIHPNDLGVYLVALVHHAAIRGEDPRGLPRRLADRRGRAFAAPTAAQAVAAQAGAAGRP